MNEIGPKLSEANITEAMTETDYVLVIINGVVHKVLASEFLNGDIGDIVLKNDLDANGKKVKNLEKDETQPHAAARNSQFVFSELLGTTVYSQGIEDLVLGAKVELAEKGFVYAIQKIYINDATVLDRINIYKIDLSDNSEVICASTINEFGVVYGIKEVTFNANSGFDEKFILTINYDKPQSVDYQTRMIINPINYSYNNTTINSNIETLNEKTIGLDTNGKYTAPIGEEIDANNQGVKNIETSLLNTKDAVNVQSLVFSTIYGISTNNSELNELTKQLLVLNAEKGYVYYLRQVFNNHSVYSDSVRIYKVNLETLTETQVTAAASGKDYGVSNVLQTITFDADVGNEKFILTFDYSGLPDGDVAGDSAAKNVINPINYTYTADIESRLILVEGATASKFNELLFTKTGETLQIFSKYASAKDLFIEFGRGGNNNTYTFRDVRIKSNTNEIPNIDTDGEQLLALPSDNIGPHWVYNAGWHGGVNHGFERSECTATAHGKDATDLGSIWSYDGSEWVLAEIIDADTLIFDPPYATITKDLADGGTSGTLTHVSGATHTADINWSNYVRNTKPSVKSSTIQLFADGIEIVTENTIRKANQIDIIVTQEIYDLTTINYANGYDGDVLFNEYLSYRITPNNIELAVKIKAIKDYKVSKYYGMQLVDNPWENKIYFENGVDTSIQDKTDGLQIESGDSATYNNVNRAIISSSDFTKNIALILDTVEGLGANRDIDHLLTPYIFKSTNDKTYYYLIYKQTYKSMAIGDTYFWHGNYVFFDASELTNASFAYVFTKSGETYLDIDFHTSGSETIPLPNNNMKVATIVYNNGSLTVDDLFISPQGVTITATGYGNLRLKLK